MGQESMEVGQKGIDDRNGGYSTSQRGIFVGGER